MGTIAVRRGFAALLATLLAVVACYIVFARGAEASARPASGEDKTHRTVIGSGVKFVRNADGSITQTR